MGDLFNFGDCMGRAAKKSAKMPDEGVAAGSSPAAALRAELCDAARKAAKSAQAEEALHHFIAVFILDANLASNELTHDEDVLSQIKKIAKNTKITKKHPAAPQEAARGQTVIWDPRSISRNVQEL